MARVRGRALHLGRVRHGIGSRDPHRASRATVLAAESTPHFFVSSQCPGSLWKKKKEEANKRGNGWHDGARPRARWGVAEPSEGGVGLGLRVLAMQAIVLG